LFGLTGAGLVLAWDYPGDSISFGYGDTVWLSGFPESYGFVPSMVAIVGFQPQ
jgi:hypothetical protein